MKIEQYDVVMLKNGRRVQIVEILEQGKMYVADIQESEGWPEDDTVFLSHIEIEKNLKTW